MLKAGVCIMAGSWVLMANLRDELNFFAGDVRPWRLKPGCWSAWRSGWTTTASTLRLGEKGRVASVGDGIAWVYGLPSAAVDEILHFEDGSRGLVFELQKERLGVILLDPAANVASGSLVSHTGERLEIGVGDALLGRVIDPLGKPLDGLPPPEPDGFCALEAPSPPIVARDFVNRPLYTGIKVVDTLIPIGRGQRQLIIGDAGTGKTSLALDTVMAQAGQDVKCVYVMIGQKRSEAAQVIDLLRRHGALAYTTVVVGEATATPGMKYLAPFAGCAVAEGWMRRGEDTLVVYDDLTTHARAYRELSLLMHRPPGREAYPGDIFYLHARLLERSTRLSPEHGGGSLTALPIVETEEGEIAAYIPTNLISITDGQIYLDRRLFAAGVLPAVDVPLSVSRIGGKAQHPRIKEEAGTDEARLPAIPRTGNLHPLRHQAGGGHRGQDPARPAAARNSQAGTPEPLGRAASSLPG